MVRIERAIEADLEDIASIYNWAIVNTTASFEMEEQTLETLLTWFRGHDERHPVIVSRLKKDNQIVGWGAITKWSSKPAYDGMAEVSVYVHPEYHRQGIGKQLILELIELGRKGKFRTLVSQISDTAEASLYLHRNLGFIDTGILRRAGVKFGQEIDVLILQLFFSS